MTADCIIFGNIAVPVQGHWHLDFVLTKFYTTEAGWQISIPCEEEEQPVRNIRHCRLSSQDKCNCLDRIVPLTKNGCSPVHKVSQFQLFHKVRVGFTTTAPVAPPLSSILGSVITLRHSAPPSESLVWCIKYPNVTKSGQRCGWIL